MNLSIVLVGVWLFSFVAALDIVPKREVVVACEKQFGVNNEVIEKLRDTGLDNVSENVKCFANCILEGSAVIQDGAFTDLVNVGLRELAKTYKDDSDLGVLFGPFIKCLDVKANGKCELAYQFTKCLYPEYKKIDLKKLNLE